MPLTIISSILGEIQYSKEEVYYFEQGIPGFPEQKEFLLVKVEDSIFTVMHSIKDDLYFFLIDPFTIFSDYEFTIPQHVIEQLQIEKREDVFCYSIVVIREPLSTSTTNLVAPVIFNTRNRKAVQFVLENVPYSIRQPLFLNEQIKKEISVGQEATERKR